MRSEFYTEKCARGIVVMLAAGLLGCAHVESGSGEAVSGTETTPALAGLQEPVDRWGAGEEEVAARDSKAVAEEVSGKKEPPPEPEPEPEPEPVAAPEAAPEPEVEKPVATEAERVPETPPAPAVETVNEEAAPPAPPPKPVQNRKTHYQAALKLIEVARMDVAFPRMLEDIMKPYKQELRKVPEEFWTSFSENADYTAVRKALADRYVAEFAQDEIEELTAFYGSPVGQKLVERNLEIQRVFSIDSRDWVKKTKDLLTRRLRAKSYMY